ncbi:MAG: inorganic diphosphatase [Rickettsiaceae bacterium H1]|nr:inorganic diphosphatase [Rickettsiaceae bacterium H1]
MNLSKITAGKNVPEEVNAVIDIAANSTPIKYEINEETGVLTIDRFLPVSMHYPCNYGFIPHTKGGDGDYIDVLVITRYPLLPQSVISVRPIGILIMEDEGGKDVKILSVPITKIDCYYESILNYSDLPQLQIKQIEHFFTRYKDLEKDKYVKITGWEDNKSAKDFITKSLIT